MDKKIKKKIDTLQQRIQRLRQQLAGVSRQKDETQEETAALRQQLADAEAEVAKLKDA